MHPPPEHRQARVRLGHHTDKLEQIRDQLNQSRRAPSDAAAAAGSATAAAAAAAEAAAMAAAAVDNTPRNLATLLACGAERNQAIEALSKTSSVAQAAQWLFDNNRTAREEYQDEPRSSELPIGSMTQMESVYGMNAKSRAAPAAPAQLQQQQSQQLLQLQHPLVGPTSSVLQMRPQLQQQPPLPDQPHAAYYSQRILEDAYAPPPSARMLINNHSVIAPNYSLPPSLSSSHSSAILRSPSPSIASSTSSQSRHLHGPSPAKTGEYNRTHLKMTLSANSPFASSELMPATPSMSKVSIHKMSERDSPHFRPSLGREEYREDSSVPVMKARLPTLPSNLSINVKSVSGRPVDAHLTSEDPRYYQYPIGVPSTSSSSIYLNSTSTIDNVSSKVIYQDEVIRAPPLDIRGTPSTKAFRAPSPNLPTYTQASQAAARKQQQQPIPMNGASSQMSSAQVFIGRTSAFPSTSHAQAPGPSTTRSPLPPPSPSGKRRSLSPLPEDIRARRLSNSHSRVVESCKPRLFRFFMEQHIERLLEQQKERAKRVDQLRKEMDAANLVESAKQQLLNHLVQKESKYMRLKRQKMNKDMFEHIKHIGVGAFGRVSLVKKYDTGIVYAMKSLLKKDVISKNQAAHVKAERDILAEADSPWIVRLFFSFQDERCLYFIMEYVPGGDMMELLIKKGWFNEIEAKFYISELTCAIEYVHSLGFIHRDIKPDNILIDHKGHLKLTDFGLCTGLRWTHDKKYYGLENDDQPGHFREDSLTITSVNADGSSEGGKLKILEARHRKKRDQAHSLVGTTSYMAPEVILRTGHTQLCDWWSVGVILYEMIYGRAPFSSEYDDEEIKSKIVNHRYELKLYRLVPITDGYNTISDDCLKIIRDLCNEQSSRLGKDAGAEDVKRHPWFKDVNFDTLRTKTAVWQPQIAHSEDTSNFEPLELADFACDSLRHPPPNNPAFYEFTWRHFFDVTGSAGSLARSQNSSHRPSFARPPIPFDGLQQQKQQMQQPAAAAGAAASRSAAPPPYAAAAAAAIAAQQHQQPTMQHIREDSTESIQI